MKNHLMKLVVVLGLVAVLFTNCTDDETQPLPSASTDAIITVPFFVVNQDGQTPSNANDKVYELRKMNPVIAPDGHQLSWAEFSSVRGTIDVQCKGNGVEYELDLSGLIPNGLYTIWDVVFQAPGMDPTHPMLGLDGLGASGKGDGSDNVVRASSTGRATITIFSTPGPLSMVSNEDLGACPLTDNFEWHVVGAYHIDDQSYGPLLGPDGEAIEQFGFIFKNVE